MIDITKVVLGKDLFVEDSVAPKAANVISTQLGSLDYAVDFGADQQYFLDQQLEFQTQSYVAYLVERLSIHGINVSDVTEVLTTFTNMFTFSVGSQEIQGKIV